MRILVANEHGRHQPLNLLTQSHHSPDCAVPASLWIVSQTGTSSCLCSCDVSCCVRGIETCSCASCAAPGCGCDVSGPGCGFVARAAPAPRALAAAPPHPAARIQ